MTVSAAALPSSPPAWTSLTAERNVAWKSVTSQSVDRSERNARDPPFFKSRRRRARSRGSAPTVMRRFLSVRDLALLIARRVVHANPYLPIAAERGIRVRGYRATET